jgi:hypothetical protein|tara:strand:- start:1871 stop:2152 length:282 start_codon:yes stop_codon:yes gene_type:complete
MKGRENSTITIKTRLLDKKMEIRFSENGPDIPEDIIDKIFGPFFTTKDLDKGTGLGLSILYSIIERQNRTISVESKVDEGTSFVTTLPVKHET